MKIGQLNTLPVRERTPYGLVFETDSPTDLLLPSQEAPPYARAGDQLEVFIYTDGDGHPLATMAKPLVCVGGTAVLKIVANTEAGAWLDWGVAQNLLLPRSEQRKHRKPDHPKSKHIFVYVVLDPASGKICATTRFHRHFAETAENLRAGEKVEIVIADKTELGFKVIINNQTLALLFEDQTHRPVNVGEVMDAYVKRVRPDGKVDVTLYAATAHQSSELEKRILRFLSESGGTSSLSDKSSPEAIFEQFQVSKKHYKRALGSLYKARLISIDRQQITLLDPAARHPSKG